MLRKEVKSIKSLTILKTQFKKAKRCRKEIKMKKMTNTNSEKLRLLALTSVLLCLSLWIGTDALAQQKGPCSEDIAKFCKDVQPGGGHIQECLKKHENELSAVCKESTEEAKKKLKDFSQACADDIKKFCKDIKPGGGQITKCLKEHEHDLSAGCKAKLQK
jgi:gas vesicle protein